MAEQSDLDVNGAEVVVRRLFWVLPLGACVTLVVLVLYIVKFHAGLSDDQDTWGQFGDYVGGLLNPIFGFISVIALLSTLLIQVRELRLSTRELRNSSDALKSQHAVMARQNFESTFFQLLRLHNDIVLSIDLRQSGTTTVAGRDCFNQFTKVLYANMNKHGALTDASKLEVAYEEFYRRYESDLGHYFRLLYNLVKFVHHSDVENKKFYTNLVRAQLSSGELNVLFVNCLSSKGRDRFKPLVETYALLKTLPDTPFGCSMALREQYSPAAFGGE
ncbi:MAG: hypothetical protein EPN60_02665 [Nevskiaceae bacterium]|nr:MAG: hypothetical protein EPO48_09255 [Nevskiaceae bacterium]TAM32988.1 MAG: hypothetical protein EPN60_02665 [Nevskiaceae bacterium]